MVLGIVALALFCVWYLSIPCAIVGLVLGVLAGGKATRGEAGGAGMAKAGVVCSIVALALDVVVVILLIAGVSWMGHHSAQFQQMMQQQQKMLPTPTTPPPPPPPPQP
jgi:hypothetical protein